jgi:hypothetical protein
MPQCTPTQQNNKKVAKKVQKYSFMLQKIF